MNHGLGTYQWSYRSFEEEEDDDEITVLTISIADSDGRRWDTLWIKDHSRNTVSYPTSLRIQAFDSLDALKMYYTIGASVSSLHRESTDSNSHERILQTAALLDLYTCTCTLI